MQKIKNYIGILLVSMLAIIMKPVVALAAIPEITIIKGDLDFNIVIGKAADWIAGFAGAVGVIYLIYGGFLYITGGAKADETAKKIIMNAIIGLIVIALSYFIVNLVVSLLTNI